jgi:hypothetical protein
MLFIYFIFVFVVLAIAKNIQCKSNFNKIEFRINYIR